MRLSDDGRAVVLIEATDIDESGWLAFASNPRVTKIGRQALPSFYQLKAITLPDCITEIGYGAFQDSMNLETIEFSKRLTKIDNCVFSRCSSLETLTLPKSLTNIGTSAFTHCKALKVIELSENLTEIGPKAFFDCKKLARIVIHASSEAQFRRIQNLVLNACDGEKDRLTFELRLQPSLSPSFVLAMIAGLTAGGGLLALACVLLPPVGLVAMSVSLAYSFTGLTAAAGAGLLGFFGYHAAKERRDISQHVCCSA